MGAAGLCLSCLATVLLAVSAATESWLWLWVRGAVVHRGLWRECRLWACSPLQGQRAYMGVSRGCLVLAILAGYLSVLCGALALAPRPAPRGLTWTRGAAALCFLTGALATLALGCFMGGAAREVGGSWAWSLAVCWAAVPAAGLAGICHCQAGRWERPISRQAELLNPVYQAETCPETQMMQPRWDAASSGVERLGTAA
ncbi:lens fiber membrane intrinsic protein-like [Carettochelys insculpta]|uniref:lens fiber membrane intrinsic protein-like n=1 Tax=Carettochelys insculpta TaxID=44489 RepID=UPI003EB7E33B